MFVVKLLELLMYVWQYTFFETQYILDVPCSTLRAACMYELFYKSFIFLIFVLTCDCN